MEAVDNTEKFDVKISKNDIERNDLNIFNSDSFTSCKTVSTSASNLLRSEIDLKTHQTTSYKQVTDSGCSAECVPQSTGKVDREILQSLATDLDQPTEKKDSPSNETESICGMLSGEVNHSNSMQLENPFVNEETPSLSLNEPSCSTSSPDPLEIESTSSGIDPLNVPSACANSKTALRSSKSAEMHYYIDKLREMVPYAKNAPKLSKVQLIHSAIDYITDLQEALEARVKRKKSNTQSSNTTIRSPLSALPVTQQHNEANISEATSLPSGLYTRQPIQSEDLHRPESLLDPVTIIANQAPSLQRVNMCSDNSKLKRPTNERTNSSNCIEAINQLFIRKVQEEAIEKCSINKVNVGTDRTKVLSDQPATSDGLSGPSKVHEDWKANKEVTLSTLNKPFKQDEMDEISFHKTLINNIPNRDSLPKKRPLDEC